MSFFNSYLYVASLLIMVLRIRCWAEPTIFIIALRMTICLLVSSLHLLHPRPINQTAPVNSLLDQLTLLQPVILVWDRLLLLFVQPLLFCFVLFDAFDFDLEGTLDGILKDEVTYWWTSLEIFSKHLIGFIKLRACKKTEICVNAFYSNFGWHSTCRSGQSSSQPSLSSQNNFDPLSSFLFPSDRKIFASTLSLPPLWVFDLVESSPWKIFLLIGFAVIFLDI